MTNLKYKQEQWFDHNVIRDDCHVHVNSPSIGPLPLSLKALEDGEKDPDVLPPFLEFSPSGVVEAEVVYANYGTLEELNELEAMNVSVQGKIVLVRQGRIFRGNKVTFNFNTIINPITIPFMKLSPRGRDV